MTTPLCSRPFDDLPAWGTAPRADFWVALEQPGPWGAKAFTESQLDPAVGDALDKACSAAGGKALLIRRTGAHPVDEGPRRVYVSGGPLNSHLTWGDPTFWVATKLVADPAELLELPFGELAGGGVDVVTALGYEPCDPVALVCTNAKRDTCCAVRGRPVARAAAEEYPDDVWECSHTGGHRFAPTLVVLPTGQLLAHATARDVVASLRAARQWQVGVTGPKDRGLSRLAPQVQAATAWVMAAEGIADLILSATVDGDVVELTDSFDMWRVVARKTDTGMRLPESCGKDAKPVELWDVGLE